MNSIANNIRSCFFYWFLFCVVSSLVYLFSTSIAHASQCDTNAYAGIGFCSNSYYTPAGAHPAPEWGYFCENSTNTSLVAPYCYFNNGGARGTDPNYCGDYKDLAGGYAGCMSNSYPDRVNGGFVFLWGGSCPSGYSEITPQSAGISNFFDCINAGANQAVTILPCCVRTAPVGSVTCTSVGGYCQNFLQSGGVCSDFPYHKPNPIYDSTCPGGNDGCCVPQDCTDVNGICSRTSPGANYVTDPAGSSTIDQSCGVNQVCWQPRSNFPACTTGTSCGACNATAPANTCGTFAGTQSCTNNLNSSGNTLCNPSTFNNSCTSGFINNCSANYTCTNGNTCTTSVTVWAFKDYNHDGNGAVDDNFNGINVSLTNTSLGITTGTQTTGPVPAGRTTFTGLRTGNYTLNITVPANYQITAPASPFALTNANGGTTIFPGLTPLYNISGHIFNDTNLNGKFDGGDTGVGGGTVTVTGGPTTVSPITVAANGTWTTPTNLLSGTYTVKYTTALPAGYTFQTSSTYSISVGDPAAGTRATVCNTGGNLDAVCGGINNGSVSGVDIGMTNEHSHYGSVCLDIRTDNNGGGTVSDLFPAPGATCGGANGSQAIINNGTCSTGSGIVFSCNGTFDFGLGTADANNLTAGGTAAQDTECYTGGGLDVVPTSYGFLTTTARESNITPTNLDNLTNPNPATSCTLTDCVLPAALPKGIYLANGNLTLDAATYTFPAPLNPSTTSQAYIILVNGNLTIKGNIKVPLGSVVVFSASGNITIDPGVGNIIIDPTSTTVNTPNLEGIYSADQSVIIQSNAAGGIVCNANGTPLDKRLVVLGVVISNAAKGGGTLVNNRDLCEFDTSCTSLEVGDGINAADQGLLMNYLLNLMADGQFVSTKNFNWQELKP